MRKYRWVVGDLNHLTSTTFSIQIKRVTSVCTEIHVISLLFALFFLQLENIDLFKRRCILTHLLEIARLKEFAFRFQHRKIFRRRISSMSKEVSHRMNNEPLVQTLYFACHLTTKKYEIPRNSNAK